MKSLNLKKMMSCSLMRKQMEKLSALSLCVSSMFTTFQVIIKNAINTYSVTVNPSRNSVTP